MRADGAQPALRAGSLRLEPQCAHHADEMFAVLGDPAIYEFENAPPASPEALRLRYAMLESRLSPDGTEQWLNWVVRLPSGELAGSFQATVLADHAAYVAYELASRFWRRGIASAGLQRVLEELAAGHDVRSAFAVLKAANFRSRGLLLKLGFEELPEHLTAPWLPQADEVVMHKRLTGSSGS